MKSGYQIVSQELDKKEQLMRIVATSERYPSPLAINAYPLKGDSALAEKYRAIAQILQETKHPNLAQTYEHWTENDVFYVAQELLSGPDLEAHCKGHSGRKDFVITLIRVFRGLAWALDALHMTGLSHGRITPQQIRVVSEGMAKLPFSSLSQDSTNIGHLKRQTASEFTMASIAPEERAGSPTDYLTDVFALGSVMYSAFARYASPSDESSVNAAALDPLSASLHEIIQAAVQNDRSKRIGSARRLAGKLSMLEMKLPPSK